VLEGLEMVHGEIECFIVDLPVGLDEVEVLVWKVLESVPAEDFVLHYLPDF
jgi:hypothetical protein